MGRPTKKTAEYFSHDADASEGKTLSILFNNFGHEGLSAWWLLLERISRTNNHVVCIRNPEDLEFLSAKMHFKPERLREILNKMSELEAIDPELYAAGKIWCQNLVDRLKPLYQTRKQLLPSRPEFIGKETPFIGKETPLIIPETPQSKLKETKVKETKPPTTPPPGPIPAAEKELEKPVADPEPTKVLTPLSKNFGAVCRLYEQNIGMLSPILAQELDEIATTYEINWIEEAIKEACVMQKRHLKYVGAILERWGIEGYKAPMGKAFKGILGRPNKGQLPTGDELEKAWKGRKEK